MSNRVFSLLFQTYVLAALAICCLPGCGGSNEPASTEDPAPFLQAVEKYFDQNNMGMSLKELKAGPTVEGDTATLTASFTRSQAGGPSITWTFTFTKDPQGTWAATGYDK